MGYEGDTLEGFCSICVLFPTLLLGSSSYSPVFLGRLLWLEPLLLRVSLLYLTSKLLCCLLGFFHLQQKRAVLLA